MIDIVKLDKSLKLKSLGRLENTRHPFLRMIRVNTDTSCSFYPKQVISIK